MLAEIVHPDISPMEIPQPEMAPIHPGSERPEIVPPETDTPKIEKNKFIKNI